MKKTIQFLSIGDILIDAFIELLDAEVHCDIDKDNCKISMRWGDKIPYKKVTVVPGVGNAPNAAVSAARLGLDTALLTHIGKDKFGEDCLQALKGNKVKTDHVIIEDGKDTNYHYVLMYNAERTILIKHEDFTYNLKEQIGDTVPEWVYFTSVGEKSMEYHQDIAKWVKENEIKMAFQPGTFQISLGYEKLKFIYEASEILFCNKEEARKILKKPDAEIEELLKSMRELGPNIVCITDGPEGAYAYDGNEAWYMPMYPDPKDPVDRTGAGDSFSSTFTAALAAGKTIPEALAWGPINSMSVVQYVGAQEGLLTKDKLEEYLENAPEDYKAKKVF